MSKSKSSSSSSSNTLQLIFDIAPNLVDLFNHIVSESTKYQIEKEKINIDKELLLKDKDVIISKVNALKEAYKAILDNDVDLLKESNAPFIKNIQCQCDLLRALQDSCLENMNKMLYGNFSDKDKILEYTKFIFEQIKEARNSLDAFTKYAGEHTLGKMRELSAQHRNQIAAICDSSRDEFKRQ